MKYRALVHFEDILDGRHPYNVGDEYPRRGCTPSEVRIAELLSANNKMGTAVIEAVVEKPDVVVSPVEQAHDNESLVTMTDDAKPKRGRRRRGE